MLSSECDSTGVLRLGSHVADADIALPHGTVKIGLGEEVALVAPLSIECSELAIDAASLDVKAPAGGADAVVFLQAQRLQTLRSPVLYVRDQVTLAASWPGVNVHPWTGFATEVCGADNTDIADSLRRLRRLLTAFRARGQGKLGRFKGKIESARMTKGTGKAVLEALLSEGILRLDDKWYILDTDALGKKLDVSYVDCHAHRFGELARQFVKRAVEAE